MSKIEEPLESPQLTKQWQFDLRDKLLTKPDNRSIFWYWSETGGVGKTSFVKHIFDNYNALYLNKGKYADMMMQITEYTGVIPKIFLIDIPRSMKNISYAALESIKDGLVAGSKYKGGVKRFNSPHIVVFCNFPPEEGIFSDDRIIEVNLDEI